MGRVGVDRLAQGPAAAGGSGGGATTEFLTGQTIANGSSDFAHTLGEAPDTVLFFNSSGQPIMLSWIPKVGAETTQITVTNAMPQFTGATIQLAVAV